MGMPSKVLLVEDEAVIAMALAENLMRAGCTEVETAVNGEEALEILASSFKPELVLLDINLGRKSIDGTEIAWTVRKKYELPFIYVTSYTQDAIIDKVKETDPYGFVTKPISFSLLKANIAIAMHRHATEQQLKRERLETNKMRMLSEVNPNLIIRFSDKGEFLYANPMIARYLGNKASTFFLKNLDTAKIDPEISVLFSDLLDQTIEKGRRTFLETSLPTLFGRRFVEINTIPERDTSRSVSSVLMIINDITDQKIILDEIKTQNKKVSDSINYSKNIQNTILPNQKFLKQYFENVFIVNKPKDVVSGDMPWFFKSGNLHYVACIDCTGHGVPGALMSLIVYFLLNDIIKADAPPSPAKVLDELHNYLQQTLHQGDPGSTSRDGADVAMCLIDKEAQTLTYAGAYRPLLYVREGKMDILKGDRLSIGGDRLKKEGNRFEESVIQIHPGDQLFIYTDGVTDQFGDEKAEADENPKADLTAGKKFGGKMLRDLILQLSSGDFNEIPASINQSIEQWKGKRPQTDDILMIGIKF